MTGRPTIPIRLAAYLGGCFSVSFDLELRDGVLLVQEGDRPDLKSTRICPSSEEWAAFRRSLDEVNVWCWSADYANPGILDGTQWALEITYPDCSVDAHGDNNFPGPDGEPNGGAEETRTFQRFVAAVEQLLGRERFDPMLPGETDPRE